MYCNYAGMQMPYSPVQGQQIGPTYQEQYQQAVRKISSPPRTPLSHTHPSLYPQSSEFAHHSLNAILTAIPNRRRC
jgi:hypothetical protein